MKIKADLHNHLGTSIYKGNYDKVVDKTSKKLGGGGILGIIDSGSEGEYDNRFQIFSDSITYDKEDFGSSFYIPKKDLLVVHGQEIEHNEKKQGHILVFGLPKKKHIKRNNLVDSLKEANDNNTVVILDHPFFFQGGGEYFKRGIDLIKHLHGIEVFNGEALWGNELAKRFYRFLCNFHFDIGACSFSDGHSLYEIGSCYTLLNKPIIKKGKLIESLRNSIVEHKNYSKDKQNLSYIGFLDHSLKMIGTIALSKVGIKI